MGLDVTEYRRHHADKFLSCDYASVFGLVDEFVHLLQPLIFPQQLLRQHHLINQILRIKFLAIHFEFTEINHLCSQLLLVLMIRLAHLNIIIFIFFLLCLNCMIFYEFGILKHLHNFLVAHEHGVYSEGYGKFFEEGVLKMFEFFIGCDNPLKLLSIILIKLRAAHHVRFELVIALFIAYFFTISDSTLPIFITLNPLSLLIPFFLPDLFPGCRTIEFLLVALAEIRLLLAAAFRLHTDQ